MSYPPFHHCQCPLANGWILPDLLEKLCPPPPLTANVPRKTTISSDRSAFALRPMVSREGRW